MEQCSIYLSNLEKLLIEIRKDISGKSFEIFCKWFLDNDPYWKTQVEQVWLWDNWPERWDINESIDLVFKHKNGQTWAIQSKCCSEDYYITKEDIDSFLSDSNNKQIHKRLLVGTTDKLRISARKTMAEQEKPVVPFLLNDLKRSVLEYPSSLKGLISQYKKNFINPDSLCQQKVISDKTIQEFGEQWSDFFPILDDYSIDPLSLQDTMGSLLSLKDFKNKNILEIGSGMGRIVNMLLDVGANHVYALEPSKSFNTIIKNTSLRSNYVTVINSTGDKIPANINVDYIIAIGVIHHIPDANKVMFESFNRLKAGGKMLIWLYGKEGNEFYLFFYNILKKITLHISKTNLLKLSHLLNIFLMPYRFMCVLFPFLPMTKYFKVTFNPIRWKSQVMTIFDQLNPTYAKYYTYDEAYRLMKEAGFKDIKIEKIGNYSWSVIGSKLNMRS